MPGLHVSYQIHNLYICILVLVCGKTCPLNFNTIERYESSPVFQTTMVKWVHFPVCRTANPVCSGILLALSYFGYDSDYLPHLATLRLLAQPWLESSASSGDVASSCTA